MLGILGVIVTLITIIRAANDSYRFDLPTHLARPDSKSYRKTFELPLLNIVDIRWKVTYYTKKCCPYMSFASSRFDRPSGYFSSLFNLNAEQNSIHPEFSVEFLNPRNKRIKCEEVSDWMTCIGFSQVDRYFPRKWHFEVGYKDKKPFDLQLVTGYIEFRYHANYTYPCEPMDNYQPSFCTKQFGYKYTSFPNLSQHMYQQQALQLFNLIQRYIVFVKCYQHAIEMACRWLFPECQHGKRIYPCKQMCQHANEGCGQLLHDSLQLAVTCNILPDSSDPEICIYKPIKCSSPKAPTHGEVEIEGQGLNNTSRYHCNDGYVIDGEPIRQCGLSGTWNGSAPLCKLNSAPNHLKLIVIPVLVCIFGFAIFLRIYFRKSLQTYILYNRHLPSKRGNSWQKSLFTAYSSQDMENVLEFLPNLKSELNDWIIKTYQDDFIVGQPILDCITEGVWESDAVLVLLTENFMNSSWCLHEFIEAETRSVQDHTFKLIVVMFSLDQQVLQKELIQGLPETVKHYICERVYLGRWEPLFWNKLRKALSN